MIELGRLGSGEIVVDRPRSHLDDPTVVGLLPEALAQVDSDEQDFIVQEVDLGREVGETICVATKPGDKIRFFYRPGRDGPTRFVIGRKPEPCSAMTLVLKKARSNLYILVTAYIGYKAEPEPWDRNATEASQGFWAKHALVLT